MVFPRSNAMKTRCGVSIAGCVAALAAGAATAYALVVRPWHLRWGATDEEVARTMPGDEAVANPNYTTTRAITVNARPEHIFPWLVQMGNRRGGLYSYDFLDRIFGILDGPSANEILPQFQDLKAGDEIPIGKGPGFPVWSVEPNRALVLAGEERGFAWSWQMVLYPLGDDRTRLVSRNRARVPRSLETMLQMAWIDPAAFVMVRGWLLNLKARAEALAARDAARLAPTTPAPQGEPW